MLRRTSIVAVLLVLAIVAAACTSQGNTTTTSPAGTSTPPPVETTTTTTPPQTTATTVPVTTTTSEPAMPAFTRAPCEFDEPEGRTVDCGWVDVPEDRADPSGGTIRLHVATFRSESSDPAPDPVVYLEGGPGGDSLELVPLLFEDGFSHLLADRDVIFFDQRGTGYSEPSLACPELRELGFEIIDEDLPAAEIQDLQLAALEECRGRIIADGADLDAYTSAASAADLADLRLALGYDEWNLYGISYGTRLALTTLRDHPEGIRSVVLDSVYPPDVDIVAETPRNLNRALRELFDGCAADAACAAAFPELEATFYQLIRDLDAAPLRAPVTDVFTGEVYDAVFNGGGFGGIVFQALYSEEAIPILPTLIDNVASGETYELSLITSSFQANGEFVSFGMQLSVQCHEEAGFSSPDVVAAELARYPRLESIFSTSPNIGPHFYEVCEMWAVDGAAPVENQPVTSAVPTLVLAGEYDPITPPAWSRQAAATLEASSYVEFPGLGHGPSAADECPQSILRAFLDAPAEPVDASCVEAMGPPEFTTPDTTLPAVDLVPFSEESGGAAWSGVAPAGWERQNEGVWARGATAFDQSVIAQQVAIGASPALLLVGLSAQFGLGDDPQPVEEYPAPSGTWLLYEGEFAAVPASIALLDASAGAALVLMTAAPSELDALRQALFFPALDAFAVE